jgi:salicylate hydroxylase
MHAMLRESACGEHGDGIPVTLKVNHRASDFEVSSGTITFENGLVAVHDVIIGADGIGSVARNYCGFKVERKPADVSCLHTNVMTEDAIKLGLVDYSKNSALEYWGGQGSDYKIVLSPCNGGKLLSYYCFFPREKGDFQNQSWDAEASVEDLLAPFPDLDLQVRKHLEIGIEIKPWRLWVHQPYPTWQNGCLAIMGDAAHPVSKRGNNLAKTS